MAAAGAAPVKGSASPTKVTKDLSINAIQEHENQKKYAKHLKALNEAQPTLALHGVSEEVDQFRRNAEKRREAAAYFQEKGKCAIKENA